jgi:hypothetical protein
MRKIVPLALVAGALSLGAVPATAATCYGADAAATHVHVCNERVWEYQVWYLSCAVDTNGDGRADVMCAKTELIRYMG